MPQVHRIEKARKSPGNCETCHKKIEPGQPYYHWSFRYGGKHKNCGDHNPKPSQLTQGKMSAVYSAVEEAAEAISDWGNPERGKDGVIPFTKDTLPDIEDLKSIIETCKDSLQEVADEYREAAEAAPNFAEQNEERADAIENAVSELDNVDFDEFDEEEDDEDEELAETVASPGAPSTEKETFSERVERWVDDQRGKAQDAISEAEGL